MRTRQGEGLRGVSQYRLGLNTLGLSRRVSDTGKRLRDTGNGRRPMKDLDCVRLGEGLGLRMDVRGRNRGWTLVLN